MQTENILIAHPTTTDQINVLKAVLKAFKVQFEIKKSVIDEDIEPTKAEVLENVRQGFKELKLIQEGKLSTVSAKDFLNDL